MLHLTNKLVIVTFCFAFMLIFGACNPNNDNITEAANAGEKVQADSLLADTTSSAAIDKGAEKSNEEAEKIILAFIKRKHLNSSEMAINDFKLVGGDYSGDGLKDFFSVAFIGMEGFDFPEPHYFYLSSEKNQAEEITVTPSQLKSFKNFGGINPSSIQKDLISAEVDFYSANSVEDIISERTKADFTVSGSDIIFNAESLNKMKKADRIVQANWAKKQEQMYPEENAEEQGTGSESDAAGD